MLQFRNLRFRTKFAVLIGFVLAGLALLGWVSFDTLTQVEVNGVLYQELARGARIGSDFNASSEYLVESEMDAYRLTTVQNPAVRARVLKDFDGARRRFEQRHAYWLKHAPDRAEGALITGAVAQAGEQYFSIADSQFLPAVERGDLSTAATVLEGPMRAAFRLNRDAAERVISMNESYRTQMESQAAAIVARRKHVLEGVILLVLAGVLLLGLAMARSVTGAMDESVEVLNAVAAGELTRRLNLQGEDEIGQMARSLNQAIDSMHETVMALTQGAQNIASASEEISANASQTAQGADLQKDQSAQVATAMQEMTATVQEVAANAHNVAEAAHEASRSARHGGTVVEQTVGRIRTVAATLQSSSQAMQALGQRSSEIGTIIEVIDDIADQTNLLALNAAIEAARAGDQGRGFAVVADEVRKLAERTATATREIGGMISSMQKETREAVAAMLAGNKQMEEGVSTAAEAGQAIAEIVIGIDRVNSMVAQIAAASSQQSAATDQVNQSMERIAHISGEAAVGAQQAARACQDLSHLALDLQNLVARFQVASSHHEGRGGWRQAAPRTLAAAQA